MRTKVYEMNMEMKKVASVVKGTLIRLQPKYMYARGLSAFD